MSDKRLLQKKKRLTSDKHLPQKRKFDKQPWYWLDH